MKPWICAIALLSLTGLSACDYWGNQDKNDDERSILNQNREDDNGRQNNRDEDDQNRGRDREDD